MRLTWWRRSWAKRLTLEWTRRLQKVGTTRWAVSHFIPRSQEMPRPNCITALIVTSPSNTVAAFRDTWVPMRRKNSTATSVINILVELMSWATIWPRFTNNGALQANPPLWLSSPRPQKWRSSTRVIFVRPNSVPSSIWTGISNHTRTKWAHSRAISAAKVLTWNINSKDTCDFIWVRKSSNAMCATWVSCRRNSCLDICWRIRARIRSSAINAGKDSISWSTWSSTLSDYIPRMLPKRRTSANIVRSVSTPRPSWRTIFCIMWMLACSIVPRASPHSWRNAISIVTSDECTRKSKTISATSVPRHSMKSTNLTTTRSLANNWDCCLKLGLNWEEIQITSPVFHNLCSKGSLNRRLLFLQVSRKIVQTLTASARWRLRS